MLIRINISGKFPRLSKSASVGASRLYNIWKQYIQRLFSTYSLYIFWRFLFLFCLRLFSVTKCIDPLFWVMAFWVWRARPIVDEVPYSRRYGEYMCVKWLKESVSACGMWSIFRYFSVVDFFLKKFYKFYNLFSCFLVDF